MLPKYTSHDKITIFLFSFFCDHDLFIRFFVIFFPFFFFLTGNASPDLLSPYITAHFMYPRTQNIEKVTLFSYRSINYDIIVLHSSYYFYTLHFCNSYHFNKIYQSKKRVIYIINSCSSEAITYTLCYFIRSFKRYFIFSIQNTI